MVEEQDLREIYIVIGKDNDVIGCYVDEEHACEISFKYNINLVEKTEFNHTLIRAINGVNTYKEKYIMFEKSFSLLVENIESQESIYWVVRHDLIYPE